jgi:hypothetical protein
MVRRQRHRGVPRQTVLACVVRSCRRARRRTHARGARTLTLGSSCNRPQCVRDGGGRRGRGSPLHVARGHSARARRRRRLAGRSDADSRRSRARAPGGELRAAVRAAENVRRAPWGLPASFAKTCASAAIAPARDLACSCSVTEKPSPGDHESWEGTMATRSHAVVLGASMAGLGTARALSQHFERVTLVERDALPEGVELRKRVGSASVAGQGGSGASRTRSRGIFTHKSLRVVCSRVPCGIYVDLVKMRHPPPGSQP